jgi:hypothetical protein
VIERVPPKLLETLLVTPLKLESERVTVVRLGWLLRVVVRLCSCRGG